MATVLEGVVVNSVDEDGRFTRLCSNPVRVEVIGTASETTLKVFDGERMIASETQMQMCRRLVKCGSVDRRIYGSYNV